MKRFPPQTLLLPVSGFVNSPLIIAAAFLLCFALNSAAQTGAWCDVSMANTPTERHECSFVEAGDAFYLLGGRGLLPVEAYHPADSSWTPLNNTPQEFHHFQAVDYHGLIYVMAAFEGSFPIETGIPFIYIYDPLTDTWVNGPSIPAARVRGSAGVVVRDNKFYIVCGITNGHQSGWVNWFDEYDPRTNSWTVLPDAPNARDHFAAVMAGDQLVCAGGRRSGDGGGTWDSVVYKTDIYDFSSGTWSTLASASGDIPTGRAGCSAAFLDGEVIIIGGESANQWPAHDEVEALDPVTGTWRSIDNLVDGRHGSQAIVNNGGIYVASGSGNRGCCPELPTMEAFYFSGKTDPILTALVAGSISASVSVPSVDPGSSGSGSVSFLHDSGSQAVLINDISISGATEISLDFSGDYPLVLIPGEDLVVPFTFSPADTGTFTATVSLDYGSVSTTMDVVLELTAGGCDSSNPPTGLTHSFDGVPGVLLSWDEIQGAEMCEIQGRPVGAPGFSKIRFTVPPHERVIPSSLLSTSTTYEWAVRCACEISPVDATPLSALSTFTTPSSWVRQAESSGSIYAADLRLYPNPASDKVSLEWRPLSGDMLIQLQDALGRVVLSRKVDASTGMFMLDLSGIPTGWYQTAITSDRIQESGSLLIE